MIELHQFAPAFGLMNPSPFCMKVEVFLKLAGLPYRCVTANPLKAPKGKLPVLHDGVVVPDSEEIIAYLQTAYGGQIPHALAVPETPRHLAVRRLLEDHLYFAALHLRWVEPAGWQHTRRLFDGLPPLLRPLVATAMRRKIRRDLLGQGTGRHSRAEICAGAIADLDALAALLAGRAYFGGDEPAAIDASAYAMLANLLWAPMDHPVRSHAQALPPLVAYAERMKARVGC